MLSAIDAGCRRSIIKHNELVDRNRHALNRIIHCIKFCGFHELPLRGNDEVEGSANRGVFFDHVMYTADLDGAFRDHLEKYNVVKNTSKSIQNDLLSCMLKVYTEEITREIKNSRYMFVQADETTDISCKSQFVIIVRYVKDFEPVERFLKFVELQDRKTDGLTQALKENLNSLNFESKLIAQAYNGAAVMRSSINGVQVQIKKFFPHAHYFHCHAHQLNLIIKKMAFCNKRLKLFFSNLNGIGVFFTISPKRNSQIEKFCFAQIPRVCEIHWNYVSRIISVVRNIREQILECFTSIQSGECWDQKSFYKSIGFTKILEDKELIFFVELFDDLFKYVSVLFGILQSKKSNSITYEEALKSFVTAVNHLRGNVVKYLKNSKQSEEIASQKAKRRRRAATHASVFHLRLQSCVTEACDTITEEVKENFGSSDTFRSFSIVNSAELELYRNSFPDNYVKEIASNYTMLNKDKLKCELSVLHANDNFSGISNISEPLKFINENGLDETFSEDSKLLEIVLVTPILTADSERSFSTMKQIKTFLRNAVLQDRLNCLACLSIHMEFISKITDYNYKVINIFAQIKDRRAD